MSCELVEHQKGSWHALTLTDGEISLTVLPEKGADIISLRHEKTDTEFLWTSPMGLRAATDAPTKNFIDRYEGGWQECFPTGGPPINYRGAQIGQHGEVHTQSWSIVDSFANENEVMLTLETHTLKTPFALKKKITLRAGTGIFEIEEWATNVGEEDLPVIWGQHPALGGNFLSADCKIDAPAARVWSYMLPENALTGQFDQNISGEWPYLVNKKGEHVDVSEIPPRAAHTADMLFLGDFTDGWIAITNRERKVGLAFLFDEKFFTTVWFWQMFGGGVGYPWYGRAYTAALELFTGVPDPHAPNIDHVAGTHIISAHETVHVRFKLLVYKGIKGVGRISPEGVIVPRI